MIDPAERGTIPKAAIILAVFILILVSAVIFTPQASFILSPTCNNVIPHPTSTISTPNSSGLHYGSLEIDSKPEKATVYLNTTKIGITPLKLDSIKTGRYNIVIVFPNDPSIYTKKIEIMEGEKANIIVVQGSGFL